MSDFLLPDVGEGLTEADIVTWHVKVGDVVTVNQPLVDIETAKSVVELPSPFAGRIAALLVAEGETVAVGVPIVTIDDGVGADDVDELPPPVQMEAELEGAPGPEVPGASPGSGGAAPAPSAPAPSIEIDLSNPAASGGSEGESLVGRTKADRGPVRRARRRASAAVGTGAGAGSGGTAAATAVAERPDVRAGAGANGVAGVDGTDGEVDERRERVRTKPLVRRLARDLGVDLTAVPPTGRDGTVTKDDVLAAATGAPASAGSASPRTSPATAVPPGTSYESAAGARDRDDVRPESTEATGTTEAASAGGHVRVPVKGVTRAMAQAMTSSAFTAPHVTEWLTIDCTAATTWLTRLRERREFAGLRVTPTLLVAKACLLAVRRTPEVNSTFDADAGEIVLHERVNLGLATATPRGLVVPNVKGADLLDLRSLAASVTDLVETAKAGRTPPSDLVGGTFTITNVGVFGVDGGTPIINPGESAILAVGAVSKRPWVDEASGELCVRDVVTLSLSFDHRHVDGEKGSRFLTDVAGVLRDPASALLL